MGVVHGSFVPSGSGGFFFLFALEHGAQAERGRRRAGGPLAEQIDTERLYPLFAGLPYVNAVTCAVRLPDGKSAVKVTGAALPAGSAIAWLLDLEQRLQPPFQPGPSLSVWSAAAKLLLELMARGRFIPLLRAEAGGLTAGWHLAAPEPADEERLDRLVAALPDLCRAIVPPDREVKEHRLTTARDLLTGFLRTGLESLARQFLADTPAPARPRSAVEHFLAALAGRGRPDLPPGLEDAIDTATVVETWAAPVTDVQGHGALRTGLRLNLPDERAGWEVELLLQNAAEPGALVPAEEAWAAIGGELTIGNGRFHHAEQRILVDLPAMARLYPPLEPLLRQGAPARLALEEAEVVMLLQEGALLLQQAGFPVLVPAGLVRGASLRSKMHLRPSAAAPSQFGLSQIVGVDWELALGGVKVDYDELREMARQKRSLVQVQGRWVQVDQQALTAALRHLEPHREQIELGAALRLANTAGPFEVESTSTEGWITSMLTRLREPAQIEEVPVPAGFVGALRPYQQRGLNWLAFLRRFGMGACLADDMGLGKTVQVIALLLHERETDLTSQPTLLVCPVSLVGNWRRELQRFAPSLRVMVHHGAGRTAEEAFADQAASHDVVITTYALAARDETSLSAVQWAGIVTDEAQNLKNPTTLHAQALRRMRSGYRIAMTGTPVENHLGDLWSLGEFLNPGLLGGQEEFRRTFAIPIERFHDEEAGARLKRLMQPFILRRLKTDPTIIDDLPEKLENPVVVNLTLEQATLYEAVVQETLERSAEAEGIQRHGAVLAGLTRLKQICNHPSQLVKDGAFVAGRSGKLDRLVEMLEEVLAEGDRALLFTQFAQFGGALQRYLTERLGVTVLLLDGSTPSRERDRLVERFQAGEAPLFVLSLKAGGVGLNLTAANHVFHVDRWWNPAVEDQATDRAFRIGQQRRVMVHKLITAGTLEERIDRLLTEKRALAGQVVAAGETWLGNLSTEELRSLITLERE